MIKQNAESSQEQMMRSLPSDQQEAARIASENKSLSDALRQLRDVSIAEKRRLESSLEQAKKLISKLTGMVYGV